MLNNALLVEVPTHGGSYSEGLIGAPRFINPVLAVSDADHDVSAVVFSGLLRATPEGTYVPDLAEKYTISPDGKTYTFTLRPTATFHDDKPVMADDIVFTIAKTQDSALKSPERPNWNGVQVQKVSDRVVSFTLKQAYAPFIENLTLGILPEHLWGNISNEEFAYSNLNMYAVGSGPYKVDSVARTSSGVPSSITLKANEHLLPHSPYISTLIFHFYQNEEALITAVKKGDVSAASGISPARVPELTHMRLAAAPLNRVFAVFFNQNQSEVLRDPTVRAALNSAIDRTTLVKQVLNGYGTPLTGPLPPSVATESTATASSSSNKAVDAKNQLILAGWEPGQDGVLQKTTGTGKNIKTQKIKLSLSTSNVPELRTAAEYIRQAWSAMGASVEVHIYEQGDLTQNVLRPRKYDALLFGEVIGREPDLFAFWSSSERLDPGLNIALYTNSAVDKLLSQVRSTSDDTQKAPLYKQFTDAINSDHPAVFLYAPDFVYIVPKDIQGLNLGFIETPSDRFLSVANWHRETDRVWPIFVR